MLISCTSCYSKYLLNSADLKPDGRMVQCGNCGYKWYQENKGIENDIISKSYIDSFSTTNDNKTIEDKILTPNLPSTYVKESEVSIVNSVLILLFVMVIIVGLWIFNNLEINTLVLLKYYIHEFLFNLQLIFEDIAKIIHRIIN